MRTSYLHAAAFSRDCSVALVYLKAAVPLTCDTFPQPSSPVTVNFGSPPGPWAQSCWILFPWQTYSSHQTESPCSCTQTPNNRMLVLGEKRMGPPFFFLSGKGAMWTGGQIFQGFCNGIILCDVSLKGSNGLKVLGALDKVRSLRFFLYSRDDAFLLFMQNSIFMFFLPLLFMHGNISIHCQDTWKEQKSYNSGFIKISDWVSRKHGSECFCWNVKMDWPNLTKQQRM